MKKGNLFTLCLVHILLFSCSNKEVKNESDAAMDPKTETTIQLTSDQANKLAELPLACMKTVYPNKLGQVLGGSEDLLEPTALHPAFYGCFDWHSAVHGHWSLVKLLKEFPALEKADEIRSELLANISAENIEAEVRYFMGEHNKSFERTYGWAWLLKLAEELYTWDDPFSKELEENLQPLTDLIIDKYLEFLPKLVYPIRVGEHTNTAFGLSFAWDYAHTCGNSELLSSIENRAREFYLADSNCPISWEPSGYDFLSPCLEELDLMRRVLDEDEFREFMSHFAPQLLNNDFALAPGIVSDRSDGKLVHLDGLNFSRAWVLSGLASQYPEYDHLSDIAEEHISHSLPDLFGDGYEGGHWLGSFAIYALDNLRHDSPDNP